MKKTVYIPEILEQIEASSKKQDKIDVLHKYKDVKGFLALLFICYEPYVKFHVTRDEAEDMVYDHMDIADYDLAPTNLFLEASKRMRNYTNLRKPFLSKKKVLRNLRNDFSAMHHDDIEIYKQCIDKKLKIRGLTENLIREAFPDLLYSEEKLKGLIEAGY